ncbi:MAG: arylesterase [Pseudomonadota bacterium]
MTGISAKHILPRQLFSAILILCSLLLLAGPARAQDDAPVLLVFGDSLSAGYRMDEEEGWVALLATRLAGEGVNVRVVNASVSGETTDGGLARLPAALDTHKPAIVILELGGNDGLRGLPVANIKQNLMQMVALSQAAGARVILAGIQIPPNYGPRYTGPFTSQYQEIAEDMQLPLIPFLIDGIPQQPELMQDDGIHPRAEAQGLVLENVWPVLAPVLKELGVGNS